MVFFVLLHSWFSPVLKRHLQTLLEQVSALNLENLEGMHASSTSFLEASCCKSLLQSGLWKNYVLFCLQGSNFTAGESSSIPRGLGHVVLLGSPTMK